jgi:DNA-binding transcriptional ArsR family regulator
MKLIAPLVSITAHCTSWTFAMFCCRAAAARSSIAVTLEVDGVRDVHDQAWFERVDRRLCLTCDCLVTYHLLMDDDRVFRALADPTRRHLLDRLYERDGRTLTDLESELEMTRFGVMKHLRVLEDAGVVVTRREGREKHHFLNPVPIRLIHDRWIDKYTEHRVAALADLKTELEEAG